jgi:hypothetical protein
MKDVKKSNIIQEEQYKAAIAEYLSNASVNDTPIKLN